VTQNTCDQYLIGVSLPYGLLTASQEERFIAKKRFPMWINSNFTKNFQRRFFYFIGSCNLRDIGSRTPLFVSLLG